MSLRLTQGDENQKDVVFDCAVKAQTELSFSVCVRTTVPRSVPQARLNLAQDGVLGDMSSDSASPAGTAQTAGNRFSRPSGTEHLSVPKPRTVVPGLSSGVPCGTELGTVVFTQTL